MRAKRAPPRPKTPKPLPARIHLKPWESNPEEHLSHILKRLDEAGQNRTYCNLSPADCELLTGSIKATVDALDSATCVVRQVAQDTFGKDMTVEEFANRSSYDS